MPRAGTAPVGAVARPPRWVDRLGPADPDPAERRPAPARTDARPPPAAVPKMPTAAHETAATAATDNDAAPANAAVADKGAPASHAVSTAHAVSAAHAVSTAAAAAMATARQRGRIAQRQGREAGHRRDRDDGEPARENFANATIGHVPPLPLLSKYSLGAAPAPGNRHRSPARSTFGEPCCATFARCDFKPPTSPKSAPSCGCPCGSI